MGNKNEVSKGKEKQLKSIFGITSSHGMAIQIGRRKAKEPKKIIQ